ncbi:MAG: (Fe-S)-binding protein [Candidatus Woesearchaeota archaeon]
MFSSIIERIKDVFGNTLYYPGCLTRFAAPEIEENYKSILTDIGIGFITIPEFNCCGSPVINAGYLNDFNGLVKKNSELFKKYGVKKIITNCPSCYRVFKENYRLNVEHISQTLYRNLSKLEPTWSGESVCYHDPCHLGRHSGIYNEPRKVLEAIGLKVVEMQSSKDKAICCGGGGGLRTNNPSLAKKIAQNRVMQCKEKMLVTTCCLCYNQLKDVAPEGLKVYEFSELLVKR